MLTTRLSAAVFVALVAVAGPAPIAGGPAPARAAMGATAAPAPHARPLPPCANDEATGTACVWDGRHMGNGSGSSFLALPGTPRNPDGRVIRITHREAHALLRWTR